MKGNANKKHRDVKNKTLAQHYFVNPCGRQKKIKIKILDF